MPRTTEWSFFLQHFAGTYPSTKLVPPYGSFIINTYVYKSTVDTDVSKTNEKLPARTTLTFYIKAIVLMEIFFQQLPHCHTNPSTDLANSFKYISCVHTYILQVAIMPFCCRKSKILPGDICFKISSNEMDTFK